jgi:hypothetical protein
VIAAIVLVLLGAPLIILFITSLRPPTALWWEVPGERGVGEQFDAAFKKRFGFVPRVHLTPVTSPDSLLRFLTEAKVGRIDADLLYAGAADVAGRPDRLALFEDIEAPLVKIFSPKFRGLEGVLRNVAPWKRPFSVDDVGTGHYLQHEKDQCR